MSFEENINKENIKLPKAAAPVGSYVAFKKVENYYIYRVKFQLMKMEI